MAKYRPREGGGSSRLQRVNEAVKEILAEQLPSLKDPRVGFVTVTDVRTTQDLGRADVYYTVLPDDEESLRRTQQGLESATPVLRRELGRQLSVRHVPEIVFIHDPIPAHARRIEDLIGRRGEQPDTEDS